MINYIKVSGEEISDVVDKIEDAVEGLPNATVAISCMIVAILSQQPEVAPDMLQALVQSMSELMAATLFESSGAVN